MKRRPFSILEVMIAFCIIGLCGGAMLMNFHRAYKEGQEKDVVDIVESKLRMGAQLAKISGGEVRIVIEEEGGVQKIYFEPDMNLSASMKVAVSKKTPLPHLREVVLTPNDRNDIALFYYPWGLINRDVQLELIFNSGRKTTLKPAKFAPNTVVEDPNVIEDLYPREVLEDEKEEEENQTLVHTD